MTGDGGFLETLDVLRVPEGFRAEDFNCGEEDLTAYICDGTSASDEQAGVSVSYCVHSDEQMVGYFTVLADSIQLQGKERPDGVSYPTLPAVKIGRMGVDQPFQGSGVGYWILDYVVGLARALSEQIGVRYVTLDALNRDELVEWYGEYGFVPNKGEATRRTAYQKFFGRFKPGEDPDHISMRFDILLQEELGQSGESLA